MSSLTPEQKQALDLQKNVWVTASAGSGKTKILTDRMIRLMLAGSPPHKILCLTFTKKAALEMHQRLHQQLTLWYESSSDLLSTRLQEFLERPALEKDLIKAKELYAQFINSPPQIQTFHSFCHTLAQRFPLEANLSLPLHILDENQSLALWRHAYEEVIKTLPPDGREGQAALRLAEKTPYFHERLEELYSSRLLQKDLSSFQDQSFEAELIFTPQRWAMISSFDLTPKELQLIQHLSQLQRFSPPYIRLFMTQSATPRKNLFRHPQLSQWAHQEQELISAYLRHSAREENKRYRHDLYTLFEPTLKVYEKLKDGKLDFDDLTLKAISLFENPHSMGWVTYTLFHSLDHVLIDEAQDTSIHQWCLLRHLIETLVTTSHKTVFVVGDPKQSIYSFQGAKIEVFYAMKEFVRSWCHYHHLLFEDVTLSTSFRSTPQVLDVVNKIFQDIPLTEEPFPIHQPYHKAQGLVELYLPQEEKAENLAYQWGERIQHWLTNPFYLETQGRFLEAEDIMILLPRRTSVFEAFQKELISRGLMSGEIGKIKDHPAVVHLMTLGKWILHPHDDEALVSLLQGPLIHSSPNLVFVLAHLRGKVSLWKRICQATTSHNLSEACSLEENLPTPDLPNRIHNSSRFTEIMLCRNELITHKACLEQWRTWVGEMSLFSFFHTLLYIYGGYQRMASLWGKGTQEALDAFLVLLDGFEEKNDLASFLNWLELTSPSLKTSSARGVRLMTIHGSKGLQSPVVILPDLPAEISSSREKTEEILSHNIPEKLNLPLKNHLSSSSTKSPRTQEYWRLLYVAMTRTQDRLYLSSRHEKGWYPIIAKCIEQMGISLPQGYRYGIEPEGGLETPSNKNNKDPNSNEYHTPSWLFNSVSLVFHKEILSPEGFSGLYKQHLDELLHQLLDEIPTIHSLQWETTIINFLAAHGIKHIQRQLWAKRLMALLKKEELQPLWSHGQNAVDICTPYGIQTINRLMIGPKDLWLIVFKGEVTSNESHQASQHLDQCARWVKPLYPHHQLHKGILWLASGHLQGCPAPKACENLLSFD